MKKEICLRVDPRTASSNQLLKERVAQELGIDTSSIEGFRILRKSIDARQRNIFFNISTLVYVNEPIPENEFEPIKYPNVSGRPRVIVVGAGPGGLFAALRLIELHLCPIVLERGKNVHERRKDIALISTKQFVNEESNYSFGEGGAGAFSDGKLYTRSTKRGNVDKILTVFCQHGAKTSILSDVHPHIGTDCLPKVIEAMRNTILENGGEVHFQMRVNELLFDEKHAVKGVTTVDGTEYLGPVILATGHSARDVYRMLLNEGVHQEIKGLAMGVRLEHNSHTIDCLMYHNSIGRGEYLPAAEYRMTTQANGRGVYSFCMCPGGFVIPAASGLGQVVVNGMSPSERNSRWSNSGIVVELRPEDIKEPSLQGLLTQVMENESFAATHQHLYDENNPLSMMYLQEAMEYECWVQGGKSQIAPAQRMGDFVNDRLSTFLPESSYTPGLITSPLHFWMPRFFVSRLQYGFQQFGKHYHGFLTNEATLIAVETRTSSPVRIVRNRETLEHITVPGLFPCGEGSGYAGGIVSAAIDGERCAEAASVFL